MSLWDKIRTQNRVESEFIRDLSDISYRSTGGRSEKGRGFRDGIVSLGQLPFLQDPPKDKITREMIEEYQKSGEPYIDPKTGKAYNKITGQEMTTRFNSADITLDIADIQIPPTIIDFPPFGKPVERADLELIKEKIKDDIKILKKEEKEYEKIQDILKSEKHILDNSPLTPSGKKKIEKKIKDLEAKLALIEADINKIEGDLNANQILLNQAEENIKENQAIVIQHNKDINEKLENYRSTLMARNAGKLTVEPQQPNESNEDYLTRIKSIENEQLDINLYKGKAELEQVLILKRNLRTLFSKEDLIENVLKSFTAEQKFVINKHFAEIHEYIIDTYGRNNTNLTTKDVVDVITSFLERILNPKIEFEVVEETAAPTGGEFFPISDLTEVDASGKPITTFTYGTENQTLYISNEKEGRQVYFKIAVDPNDKTKKFLLYSNDENKAGHFKQVMERETAGKNPDDVLRNIIDKYLRMDANAKKTILFDKKYAQIDPMIKFLEDSKYKLEPMAKGINVKYLRDNYGKKYTRFGAGLSGIKDPEKELPAHAYFGNLVIMLSKLYYKNILSLKHKSGRAIDGLPNTKVSNHFVDIIMDMYANKDVSGLIDSLKRDEKNLMNSIIFQAGLHKKYKVNTSESLSGLKEKHKIIEGEILAGNNNPELINELKQVLMKLHHLGAISIPSIKKYLKQFE